MSITPRIERNRFENKDRKIKVTDIIINYLGSRTSDYGTIGYCAVNLDGQWQVKEITIQVHDLVEFSIPEDIYHAFSKIAFPIDPRMTEQDIAGATHIYPNTANTGWLFGHAGTGHHHDHELLLITTIDGIMQPVFRQYQADLYDGKSAPARNRAKERFTLLSEFYGMVLSEARKLARTKHHGERHKDLHPETGHLHTEISVAYTTIKTKWEAEKATDAAKISVAFTYIENVLNIPTPETRWDMAARLEAEAKAAADAAAAETAPEA